MFYSKLLNKRHACLPGLGKYLLPIVHSHPWLHKGGTIIEARTKLIFVLWKNIQQDQGSSADRLDFDLDFKDIIKFGNISVLVTFQFW